jgi:hypothetical protein
MTNTPLFKLRPDGDSYDIQPAGVILILADTVYGPDSNSTTPIGRARAMEALTAVFKAAREGGFNQGDILMTLLSRNEVSHRVKAMAVQACAAAGNERLGVIFESLRMGRQ